MSLNFFKEVPLDALFPCASNAFTPGSKHPQIHFGELFYFPGENRMTRQSTTHQAQIHFGELFYFPRENRMTRQSTTHQVEPLYQAAHVEFGHSTHLMRGRVRGFSI
jgi:hypothetical protein